MRKLLFSIFLLPLILVFLNSTVAAQDSSQGNSGIAAPEDKMILPYPGTSSKPFLGQNHNYSVVFRGNGEAIVTLRVALSNADEKNDLKEVSLRIPKVEPKDVAVYQIIAQGYCIRYDNRPYIQGVNYVPPTCLEYSEPDYYNYYNGGKYQKAKYNYSGDTLTITLPTVIKPQKSGSFFVYFRAFGYTKKNLFGAYKYGFESLKVDEQIQSLNLGISVDADQFLKGAKGQVDYRFAESTAAIKAAPAADAGAVASPVIDRFVAQIGQGTIVKNASNLAALESYKVDGMYAGSRVKLYGKEIVITSGVLLLTLFFVIWLFMFLKKKMSAKDVKAANDGKRDNSENMRSGMLLVGASFATSILIAGYTFGIYLISSNLQRVVDYQYQSIVMLILVIVSFAVYATLLFVPAIYIGVKRGLGWGVGSLVSTVLWLVLYAIIAVVVFILVGRSPNYPQPPYMMERGLDAKPAAE